MNGRSIYRLHTAAHECITRNLFQGGQDHLVIIGGVDLLQIRALAERMLTDSRDISGNHFFEACATPECGVVDYRDTFAGDLLDTSALIETGVRDGVDGRWEGHFFGFEAIEDRRIEAYHSVGESQRSIGIFIGIVECNDSGLLFVVQQALVRATIITKCPRLRSINRRDIGASGESTGPYVRHAIQHYGVQTVAAFEASIIPSITYIRFHELDMFESRPGESAHSATLEDRLIVCGFLGSRIDCHGLQFVAIVEYVVSERSNFVYVCFLTEASEVRISGGQSIDFSDIGETGRAVGCAVKQTAPDLRKVLEIDCFDSTCLIFVVPRRVLLRLFVCRILDGALSLQFDIQGVSGIFVDPYR